MTDEQGTASLILDARVSPRLAVPTKDSTTRNVAAVKDGDAVRIGATAQVQVETR